MQNVTWGVTYRLGDDSQALPLWESLHNKEIFQVSTNGLLICGRKSETPVQG